MEKVIRIVKKVRTYIMYERKLNVTKIESTEIHDSLPKKDVKATYIGIGLLFFGIFVFSFLPELTDNDIIEFLSYFIYAGVRLFSMFYGQNTVKFLNKNYTFWALCLLFFTDISLIILGLLEKNENEMYIIHFKPEKETNNVNGLPEIKLATKSQRLLEMVNNDNTTVTYMLKNYKNYKTKETSLFPVLAAYRLNDNDFRLDDEILDLLDTFAKEIGYESFSKLNQNLTKMSPQAICRQFV